MALKSTLAGFAAAAALGGLLLLGAPQKAEAGVHIGIGVPGIYFGGYPAYGYGYGYGGGYGYYPGYYHYPRYRYHRHRYYRHGWDRPRYKHKRYWKKRHRRY
ncbi:MAG: hypothetical protein AB7S41_18905 [Parvibaculaceae bacterium]